MTKCPSCGIESVCRARGFSLPGDQVDVCEECARRGEERRPAAGPAALAVPMRAVDRLGAILEWAADILDPRPVKRKED